MAAGLATTQFACAAGAEPENGGIETEFAKSARLGQPIDLPSTSGGEVEVAVVAVVDPLEADKERLKTGSRFVGTRIVLRNEGDQAYVGTPIARLRIAPRSWLSPAEGALTGACAERFTSSMTIPPGAGRNVCVPFRMTEDASPKALRLALVSRAEVAGRPRKPPRRVSRRPKPPRPAKNIRAGEWILR